MATRDQLIQAGAAAHAAGNDADAAQIADLIRQMDAESASDPGPAQQVPAAAAEPAQAQPQGWWDIIGGASQHALSAATFGMSDKAAAYLDSKLGSRSYQDALDLIRQKDQAFSNANPWTSMAATGAGMLMGGGGIGVAAKGVARGAAALSPALGDVAAAAGRAMTPQVGAGKVANAARMAAGGAAVGAGVGALDTATDGDTSASGLLSGAGGGAALGAVGGMADGAAVYAGLAAARGIGGAVSRRMTESNGWGLLARKLKIQPGELQAAAQNYEAHTGQKPMMAQIMDMRQQDVLADMARANPVLGARMQQAEMQAGNALPGQMAGRTERITGYPTQTQGGLEAGQAADMAGFMGPRRNLPVQFTQADAPLFERIRDVAGRVRGPVGERMREAEDLLTNGNVTRYRGLDLNSMDALRQQLRTIHMDGDHTLRGPAKQLADDLTDVIERSHKGYKSALRDYGDQADFITAFGQGARRADTGLDAAGQPLRSGVAQEGFAAGTQADVVGRANAGPSAAVRTAEELATSPERQAVLRGSLGTQAAGDLTRMGEQFAQGQRSLQRIAPGRTDVNDGFGPHEFAHGVEAVVTPSLTGKAYHAVRLMKGLRMSEGTQRRIADMLTDPTRMQQGINNLQRAGATEQQIRAIVNAAVAGGGGTGGAM